MKRIEIGGFQYQFFVLPTIGIKKIFDYDGEHYCIAFAWFKRGISIKIYTKKSEKTYRFLQKVFGRKKCPQSK